MRSVRRRHADVKMASSSKVAPASWSILVKDMLMNFQIMVKRADLRPVRGMPSGVRPR